MSVDPGTASPFSAFRVPEFRIAWTAEFVSLLGDQIARVAVAVLVYDRTASAAAAALTYALTYVPAVLGGITLAWLADRYPRRAVMVTADLARAVLLGLMALPGLPVPAVAALLVATVLLRSPHTAAQGALLPQILGERYEQGLAVRQVTGQIAQVCGFAVGGVVVAMLTPSGALLLDAATFVLSAALVRSGLTRRDRPVPDPGTATAGRRVTAGLRTIVGDPARRTLVLLAMLVGCYVVPEALAVPYAAQLGQGPAVAGLLLAAIPVGGAFGAWAFVRFVPAPTRDRALGGVAVVAGIPLLPTLFTPPAPVTFVLWALSGACATAFVMQSQAAFVRRTPDALRGAGMGLANSAIVGGQGIAFVLAGLVADVAGPSSAIAGGALVGMLAAVAAAVSWARHRGVGYPHPTPSGTGLSSTPQA